MSDMQNIIKVAVDGYHRNVQDFSVEQSQDLVRKAMIEANGGSSVLDFRNIRDGKCTGLFTLIEEVLAQTAVEGLQGDEFFNTLVDFRNLRLGDKNEFVIKDSDLFVVDEVAPGTQGIRRQRLGGSSKTSINTSVKAVKIYEELNRVLAGRVDLNEMIDNVGKAFKQQLLNDVYAIWTSASSKEFGEVYFPVAGTYNEDKVLDLIAHVEAAANGKTATIMGTKKALRKMKPSITGAPVESDMYNQGYLGKFYGNPVVAVPQRHKLGTTNFVQDDNTLTIIAGDEQPIKCVYEGDPLMIMGNPMDNADLTQEYMYAERYGLAVVTAGNSGIGRYTME